MLQEIFDGACMIYIVLAWKHDEIVQRIHSKSCKGAFLLLTVKNFGLTKSESML